ncbi:superoxide dismutase [Trichoderma ceciliae]
MRSSGILAVLSTVVLGCAATIDAPVVAGNPHGVEYKATLPGKSFFSDASLVGYVKGSVSAVAAPGGKGVKFTVQFENFPKKGGPFMYHIHEEPATNGNCTSTLAHLDPYHRGETPACDASKPESCQVGDLSGKYGKITSDPYLAEYFDLYTSLQPGSPAFFGNRSIVVHYANKTRLTCANFAKLPVSGNVTKLTPTATGSRTATGAPIATGAHNITRPHNSTGHHNSTYALSPTGILTPTGIVTAPGSLTTSESFTTVPAGGSVSASATSSIVPFPGAASGNKVSISLLSGVVAAMLFSL